MSLPPRDVHPVAYATPFPTSAGVPPHPIGPVRPSASSRALQTFWAGRLQPTSTRTVATSLVVGLLGGGLVVGNRPGLGLAVVGLALWAPALPELVGRRAVGDLALAALSVALVGVLALRSAGWVVALCLVAAVAVGTAASSSARSSIAVLLAPLTWGAGVVRALPWARRAANHLLGPRRAQATAAAASAGVTVVLLVVFGALFVSADGVFASYLPHVQIGSLPGRLVVGVLVGAAALTTAHLARAAAPWSDVVPREAPPVARAAWLAPIAALDALVLAFVLVQLGGLVGGDGYVRRTAGLTYADWARRGFAQLVVATVLILVVVAVAGRRAPLAGARDRLVVRLALGLLCLGGLGVVGSALRRITLYVEAFGLTRLRLTVIVAEVALGVVLLLVAAAGVRRRTRRQTPWLPRAVLAVAGVATLGLALVNPDAQVVAFDARAQVSVDAGYLAGLSDDAVPALAALPEPLRSRLLARRTAPEPDPLAGWNLGRSRARAVLTP